MSPEEMRRKGSFLRRHYAHQPWRVEEAEKKDTPAGVAEAVLKGARTTPQNAFKVPLLGRMLASIFAQAKASA